MVGFVLPLFEDSLWGAAWWLVMAPDGLWGVSCYCLGDWARAGKRVSPAHFGPAHSVCGPKWVGPLQPTFIQADN